MLLLESRLALLWTECFDFRRAEPGALGDREDYEAAVSQALAGSATWQPPFPPTDPDPPRRPQAGFWELYLETDPLHRLKPGNAWKHLMPLRPGNLGNLTTVEAKELVGRTQGSLEGFCFPGGVGALVNVRIHGEDAPGDAVERLFRIRQGRFLHRVPERSDDAVEQSVDELARVTLDRLWRACGLERPAVQTPRGRTLVTVIDATGVDPNQPIEENSDLHRALEAFCTWGANWETAPLSSLVDARLPLNKRLEFRGHLHYAVGPGRAVWFPHLFQENQRRPRITNLGRYHRNLAVATLQTDYMVGLIHRASQEIQHNRPLFTAVGDTDDMVQRAAGALGRLHGSKNATYRTWSVRDQVDANRQALDKVREYLRP